MKTNKLQSLLLLVAIFFTGMARYVAQPSNSIAVANPNVNALAIKAESAAKMLRLELVKMNKYRVYDEFDMNEIIKANEEYKVGCYGQKCLSKLGEELKVDYVMSGSIDGLGNKIVITIKIIDVKGQALYKSAVREFDNQELELQRMLEIVLAEMHGLAVDKVLSDRLAFKNEVITSNNIGKINNSGPRIGVAVLTGSVAEFSMRAQKYGGLGIQPFTSMIGYQIEGQYVGTENFSALVEGIFNISGLEQSQFIPSFSLLNGFRFGKANWELAFGPRFGISSTSQGYLDIQGDFGDAGAYYNTTEWADNNFLDEQGVYIADPGFETHFDRDGTKKLSTSFLLAFGRTFQAGALNIPVNLFYSSQRGGGFLGINMGFNVQKSKQPINKQNPQRYN